jgi:hypothetical protein
LTNFVSQGEKSYFLKINHFGDQLQNEVVSNMHGYRMDMKNTPHYKEKKLYGATFISPGTNLSNFHCIFTHVLPMLIIMSLWVIFIIFLLRCSQELNIEEPGTALFMKNAGYQQGFVESI